MVSDALEKELRLRQRLLLHLLLILHGRELILLLQRGGYILCAAMRGTQPTVNLLARHG